MSLQGLPTFVDYADQVIFKRVGDVRPYPDHSYVQKQWAAIAPHQVRLDQLVTTKRTLDLEALLEEKLQLKRQMAGL